jgi:hypothetical protein
LGEQPSCISSLLQRRLRSSRVPGSLWKLLLYLAQNAASNYFGARLANPETMDAATLRQALAAPASFFVMHLAALQRARAEFQADGNPDAVLLAIAMHVDGLLCTAASSCVLRGLDEGAWKDSECAHVLDREGLTDWFALFARDLEACFASPHRWQGLQEVIFRCSR